MRIDLTYPIRKAEIEKLANAAGGSIHKLGHYGTHFDVCEKEFPLDYCEREGLLIDVRGVNDREIGLCDVPMDRVKAGQFVLFYTGMMETAGYGTDEYAKQHKELSVELIDALIEKGVSIIGLDMAGIRRDPEHPAYDRHCAQSGVFVVENLCHVKALHDAHKPFTVHTYPVAYLDYTGLPCRVIARVAD